MKALVAGGAIFKGLGLKRPISGREIQKMP